MEFASSDRDTNRDAGNERLAPVCRGTPGPRCMIFGPAIRPNAQANGYRAAWDLIGCESGWSAARARDGRGFGRLLTRSCPAVRRETVSAKP